MLNNKRTTLEYIVRCISMLYNKSVQIDEMFDCLDEFSFLGREIDELLNAAQCVLNGDKTYDDSTFTILDGIVAGKSIDEICDELLDSY